MNTQKKIEDKLLMKIIEILKDFHDFERPHVKFNCDIVIQKKLLKGKIMMCQF